MSKIDQKKREKKEALLLSAFELFTENHEMRPHRSDGLG